MATTLLDIITEALGDINALAIGEVPDAAQAARGLSKMNGLLDQWKAEELNAYSIARATATLTASQTSFTVGASGNINISRPVYIERVAFVDNAVSPVVEYSMGPLLTEQEWERIAVKGLTASLPSRAYYESTFPTGTLYPWPIPTRSNLLWAVYYAVPVGEFTAVADPVALPPGYKRMLVSNLAMELLPPYGRDAHPVLAHAATESKLTVKRANIKPRELSFDPGAVIPGADYINWRTGVY